MKLRDYLSIREYAENRGVTPAAVLRNIKLGRIIAERVGGLYVIHKSQLKYMRQYQRPKRLPTGDHP